jgi:hypothetical protein
VTDQHQCLGQEFLELLSYHSRLMDARARPDRELVEKIQDIAARWSAASQYFYAGFALSNAIQPAWGDGELVASCSLDAIRAFLRGASAAEAAPIERIACMYRLTIEVGQNYISVDNSATRRNVRGLNEELAQMLLQIGQQETDATARAGFLVRGFRIETDFQGAWRPDFPEAEVRDGTTLYNVQSITITIPSAFQLLVRAGDYFAANAVIQVSPPEAFNSPGLRGWCAAVRGFLYPERAVEEFNLAANDFAADAYSEDVARRVGSWSSVNIDLWAKYFRARALVSQIVRTPENARKLLRQAQDVLEGTESGWVNAQVKCFRFVLAVLDQVLNGDANGSAEDLRESFLSQMRFSGLDETDQLALQFLEGITAAFAELRAGPAVALISGRLPAALDALGRIPLLGSDVALELRSQIGRQAETELMGPVRTWMHRTLSGISDERMLQKVLLRLMQAELPLFVQLRHGVAEYGKDIVKLVAVDDRYILKMYQVKVGNIDMRKWRDSRNELEDMFYADISDVQLPAKPDACEGILIFNGHVHPLTEPLVEGWLAEQERDHGRTFTIMGLDSIVTWIVNNRLTSELREVLSELGISIAQ